MGLAFVVPTLAANPAARVGHPALRFGAEEDKDKDSPPAGVRFNGRMVCRCMKNGLL